MTEAAEFGDGKSYIRERDGEEVRPSLPMVMRQERPAGDEGDASTSDQTRVLQRSIFFF